MSNVSLRPFARSVSRRGAAIAVFAACAGLSLVSSAVAQDTAGGGFTLQALPYPGQSYTATFGNGDVLSFDGASIDRWRPDGTLITTYATFLVPVFASALAIDASESYAIVGESSNGSLARLDFATSQLVPLATLNFNYDVVQDSGSRWYVSAATCGFNCGNEIWSLDAQSGATQLEATLLGPSGPLATDQAGNLYYATQSASFPAPPGSTDVLFFAAAQLSGASVLTNADAFAIGTGFDAGNDLAYDALTNRLYLAETNFTSGSNRIFRVGASAASSELVVEGQPFRYISNLELFEGTGPALFAAYQPWHGGRLLYNTTDFFSAWGRTAVLPQRPLIGFSGPGASGAGQLDIELQGGVPNGFALFAATPTSSLGGSEVALPIASSVPLFSLFDLSQTVLFPGVYRLDAQGAHTLSVLHQGDLFGLVAVQALVLDASAAPAATSVEAGI